MSICNRCHRDVRAEGLVQKHGDWYCNCAEPQIGPQIDDEKIRSVTTATARNCPKCGGVINPGLGVGPGHVCRCDQIPPAPTWDDLRERLEMARGFGLMLGALQCLRWQVPPEVRDGIEDVLCQVNPRSMTFKDLSK